MKLIPILFSTPMVQAERDGRKNMTRRTRGLDKFNENPDRFRYDGIDDEDPTIHWFEVLDENGNPTEDYQAVKCPYGKVGDVLWVRETFRRGMDVDTQEEIIEYAADNPEPMYRCDGDGFQMFNKKGEEMMVPFKPNIHMPFKACRTFLKNKNLRAERLWDITDQDARAEGIDWYLNDEGRIRYKDYLLTMPGKPKESWITCGVPKYSFMSLWESINGEESRNANPWVWVVSFERW